MMKYKHSHTAFIEALNKLLMEQLFKVQDAQKLNDPEKLSLSWVKHLYGLEDQLNDTEIQMIRMKPMDTVELVELPLVESYLPEDTHCLRTDCIISCCSLEKNMMTSARKQ